MPELVFRGNISATLQQQARDDLQSVMDLYLTQFSIQPDGSSFTIRIAATLQSLIDYESAASGELDEAATSEWRHLWNESLAWSREDIVVNEEIYSSTQCAGRYTLNHELLHKLQEQLRDSFGDLPSWLTEGTANWAHSIHGMLDRHREYRSVVRHLRSKAATAPSLESTEQRNAQWEYSLGHFAVLSLMETAGADAPLESFRLLAPTGVGAAKRWPSTLQWRDAFFASFGISAEQFYTSFAELQESLPGRSNVRRQPSERVLSGMISRPGNSPVDRAWVTASQVDDQGLVSLMLRTMSDDAGSFEFFVPHRSNYRIGVELGSADWCHVWHADDAVANAGEDAALVWVGLRSMTKIEIAIPADKCAYRTEGDVTGNDAQPLGGILVQAIADHDDELTWTTGYTAADGTFVLKVPDPGDYRVSVELKACRAFYQHGGIVLEEDRASLVSIVDSNASGLRIQLSEGVCELQLSGVLIDAVGVPWMTSTSWRTLDKTS